MAHVELSLTESFLPHVPDGHGPEFASALDRWSQAVQWSTEPSLIIDSRETIVTVSAACCELLGLGDPRLAVGRYLLDGIRLIDFTAAQGELTEPEIANIPPLLAISSGRLARGLLRVHGARRPSTVDAIATPLRQDGLVIGSLTFFAQV